MSWATSTRRTRLPADWPTRRAAVLRRDRTCRCPSCPRCTPNGCTRRSTQADHLEPGDNHALTNLAGKCQPCHAHKSTLEGHAAWRLALAKRQSQRPRPQPRHPGAA